MSDIKLDFDDFSDIDVNFDFDFDDKKPTTTKEKIKEFSAGLWEGAKGEVISKSAIRNIVRNLLPKSFGPVLDIESSVEDFAGDLYDKVKKNTKDGVADLKDAALDVAAAYGGIAPDAVLKGIEAWASNKEEVYESESSEDAEANDVDAKTSDLLLALEQGTLSSAKMASSLQKQVLTQNATIAVKQNATMTTQLAFLQGIHRLEARNVGFNEQVTATYQRKSLELQYRSYRLQIGVAKLHERFYKRALDGFSALITNSSMSDFEKASSDRAKGKVKGQLMGGIKGKVSKYGNTLADTIFDSISDKSEQLGDQASRAAPGMRMLVQAAQMQKMMRQSGSREYGKLAGQVLGSFAPELAKKYIQPRLQKNSKLAAAGSNAAYLGGNAPGLLNSYLRGGESLDEYYDPTDPNNKWYSRLQKKTLNPMLNNLMWNAPSQKGDRTKVSTPGIKDLTNPAQWDVISRRSLIEIIPGLLTKQLTELTKISTGKKDVQDVEYNHTQGAFTSKARNQSDLRNAVFNKSEFKGAAQGFNSIVSEIDPDNELSKAARVAVAMKLAKGADRGDAFSINMLIGDKAWEGTDPDIAKEVTAFMHQRFKTREAKGVAKLQGQYDIGDDKELASLRNNLAGSFASQQRYMPNVEESTNVLANGGHRNALKEMGIIQRKNGQEVFNHDLYWKNLQKHVQNPNYEQEGDESSLSDVENPLAAGSQKVSQQIRDRLTGAKSKIKASAGYHALKRYYEEALDRGQDIIETVQRRLQTATDEGEVERTLDTAKTNGKQLIAEINAQLLEYRDVAQENPQIKQALAQGEQIVSVLSQQFGQQTKAQGVKDRLGALGGKAKGFLSNLSVDGVKDQLSGFANKARNVAGDDVKEVTQKAQGLGSRVGATGAELASTAKAELTEAQARLQLQTENNDLVKEMIGIMASARDQIVATKDATIANMTGDPAVMANSTTERQGWLKGLTKRMDSRLKHNPLSKFMHLLPNFNKPALTVMKWTTLLPLALGWKTSKVLWGVLKSRRAKKDDEDDSEKPDRVNGVFDLLRRRNKKKAEKGAEPTDKKPEEKDSGKGLLGLVAGAVAGIGEFVAKFTKFGIIESLAKFLKMGWLVSLGKLILGKKAVGAAADMAEDVATAGAESVLKGKGAATAAGGAGTVAKKGLLRRGAGLVGRGLKATAKGVGSVGKWALGTSAKNTGTFVARGLKGNVTRGLKLGGIATAAMAGYEAISDYRAGNYEGVAEDVGGGVGGILGGAAMGAAIGSVVPVVGTLIGGVVGGVIGGIGGSAIGGALYKWIASPGLLQQMRLRQYGIPDNNSDHTGKIFKLEAALEPYVKVTDDGHAFLDPSAPISKLASDFVDDPNDRDQVQNFAGWFLHRFKPVYLTHKAVSKQVLPNQAFLDLDASPDAAAKYEIAKRTQQFDPNNDNPYTVTAKIFPDLIATDQKTTEALVQDVVGQLREKAQKMSSATKSTSTYTTGSAATTEKGEVSSDILKAINPTGGKIAGMNLEGHKETSWFTGDRTVVSVGDVLGGLLPKPGEAMDDFTAARMKIYGLPSLDIDKVSTLLQLELVMANKIKFNGSKVVFDGLSSDIYHLTAPLFGLSPSSEYSFKAWDEWFTKRFLPVYLSFVNIAFNQTGEKNPTLNFKRLPPETQLQLVNAMSAAQSWGRDSAQSIWKTTASPWNMGTLNADASILANHIANLKANVKVAQYAAEKVAGGVVQAKEGTTANQWHKDEKTGQMVSNQVRNADGSVYTSNTQQTVFNPQTGQMEQAYGGAAGGVASGSAPQLDMTGKVTPLKMGPGTEEGVRLMIREAVKGGITDKKELAMLLAQLHEESGGFSTLEENLRYKADTLMRLFPNRFPTLESAQAVASAGPVAVANAIYGGRMGNNAPGDGWKYRGRGFIQLTGKDNYSAAGKALGMDLVNDPDKVSSDNDVAAKTALWFWKSHGALEDAAKKGDVTAVTKTINGGSNGLQERATLFQQYSQIMDGGKYDGIITGKDGDGEASANPSGTSMATTMAQSAAQSGGGVSNPALSGVKTAAQLTAGPANAPGSTTPPNLAAPTGPSVAAAVNAGSVTPGAKDSTASAIEAQATKDNTQTVGAAPASRAAVPPPSMNVTSMQPQQTPVATPAAPNHTAVLAQSASSQDRIAQNTAQMVDLMSQQLAYLKTIAGGQGGVAQSGRAVTPGATPAPAANGTDGPSVSFKRQY